MPLKNIVDIKKGVKILEEANFKVHPLWKLDDRTDLYYPIFFKEEFPEHDYEILIGAKFYSPMGMVFNGHLVGTEDLYCIVLFFKGNKFIFNKNLKDDCLERFKKLKALLPGNKKILISDIFPLKYETILDPEKYNNLSGVFDLFEPSKASMLGRNK